MAPYAQTNWKQGRFLKDKSYESRNKLVFSLDLNMPTVSAALRLFQIVSGRLFQIVVPATAKDRLPNLGLAVESPACRARQTGGRKGSGRATTARRSERCKTVPFRFAACRLVEHIWVRFVVDAEANVSY